MIVAHSNAVRVNVTRASVVCAGFDKIKISNGLSTNSAFCSGSWFAVFQQLAEDCFGRCFFNHGFFLSRPVQAASKCFLFHVEQSDFLFHAEISPCTFLFVPSLVQVGTMAGNNIQFSRCCKLYPVYNTIIQLYQL